MTVRPLDTSSEAWSVQLKIYRNMSYLEKLDMTFNLMDTSRNLLQAGISHSHPEYDEVQLERETIRLWLRDHKTFKTIYG